MDHVIMKPIYTFVVGAFRSNPPPWPIDYSDLVIALIPFVMVQPLAYYAFLKSASQVAFGVFDPHLYITLRHKWPMWDFNPVGTSKLNVLQNLSPTFISFFLT